MSARLIDGLRIAAEIRQEVKQEVLQLKQAGIHPGLAAILVGDDPASQVYVNSKKKAFEKYGCKSETFHLPSDSDQQQIIDLF